MSKYIKYEIKGTFKFILTLILTVLGASAGLQLYAANTMNKFNNLNNSNITASSTPVFIVVVLGLVIFGAFVTAFFYIIGSFRKELYEDRGYLTFTLPLTGKQILGSKLLVALMWSALLGLSALLFNLALAAVLFGSRFTEAFNYLYSYGMSKGMFNIIINFGLASILSAVSTLLLIYFAITLSRVSIRNKKIGGLWFIVFLILNALVSYATLKAINIIPYYIDMTTFKIIGETGIGNIVGSNPYLMSPGDDFGMILSSSSGLIVNIGSLLFSILVMIGTFLGTSYLIEKKIDI